MEAQLQCTQKQWHHQLRAILRWQNGAKPVCVSLVQENNTTALLIEPIPFPKEAGQEVVGCELLQAFPLSVLTLDEIARQALMTLKHYCISAIRWEHTPNNAIRHMTLDLVPAEIPLKNAQPSRQLSLHSKTGVRQYPHIQLVLQQQGNDILFHLERSEFFATCTGWPNPQKYVRCRVTLDANDSVWNLHCLTPTVISANAFYSGAELNFNKPCLIRFSQEKTPPTVHKVTMSGVIYCLGDALPFTGQAQLVIERKSSSSLYMVTLHQVHGRVLLEANRFGTSAEVPLCEDSTGTLRLGPFPIQVTANLAQDLNFWPIFLKQGYQALSTIGCVPKKHQIAVEKMVLHAHWELNVAFSKLGGVEAWINVELHCIGIESRIKAPVVSVQFTTADFQLFQVPVSHFQEQIQQIIVAHVLEISDHFWQNQSELPRRLLSPIKQGMKNIPARIEASRPDASNLAYCDTFRPWVVHEKQQRIRLCWMGHLGVHHYNITIESPTLTVPIRFSALPSMSYNLQRSRLQEDITLNEHQFGKCAPHQLRVTIVPCQSRSHPAQTEVESRLVFVNVPMLMVFSIKKKDQVIGWHWRQPAFPVVYYIIDIQPLDPNEHAYPATQKQINTAKYQHNLCSFFYKLPGHCTHFYLRDLPVIPDQATHSYRFRIKAKIDEQCSRVHWTTATVIEFMA